jgi:hypothetical protein
VPIAGPGGLHDHRHVEEERRAGLRLLAASLTSQAPPTVSHVRTARVQAAGAPGFST